MDKRAMVKPTLTPEMIESGAQLVRELDASKLRPVAAFWLFFPDAEAWKLVIAERELAKLGPRETYKRIQRVLASSKEALELSLADISLREPKARIVSLLSKAIGALPGIGGKRFTNNVIDGTVIEDAYIYRLPTRRSAATRQKAQR